MNPRGGFFFFFFGRIRTYRFNQEGIQNKNVQGWAINVFQGDKLPQLFLVTPKLLILRQNIYLHIILLGLDDSKHERQVRKKKQIDVQYVLYSNVLFFNSERNEKAINFYQNVFFQLFRDIFLQLVKMVQIIYIIRSKISSKNCPFFLQQDYFLVKIKQN